MMVKFLKDIVVLKQPAERLTYEASHGSISVHAWGVWPSHSVLAGQPCKQYLACFETAEEVLAVYPEAEASHKLMQIQNSFDHLSDKGDIN